MGTSGYSPYSKDFLPYNWRNIRPIKASSIRSLTSNNFSKVIIFRCSATNIATKTNVNFAVYHLLGIAKLPIQPLATFAESATSRCPETQRRHCIIHAIQALKHIKEQPKTLMVSSHHHNNMCKSGLHKRL